MSDATEPAAAPHFDALDKKRQLFVEAIAAGMTGVEATDYAGSQAQKPARAVLACRWRKLPHVKEAIAELREQFLVTDDDMVANAKQALRDLVTTADRPAARASAAATILKMAGAIAPERHVHAHVHQELKLPEMTAVQRKANLRRMVEGVLFAMPVPERRAFLHELLEDHPALLAEGA